jgi:hypothetical protein
MATNRILILAEPHGIYLRNTCEGQTHGNYGNKIWNIWQRISSKTRNKLAINREQIGDTLGTP